jgi:hypothetical protein
MDIKHFMAVHGESLKRFLLFYKLNNFSPVQPILTCNKPMDSAQLAETRMVIKTFANPFLEGVIGEFPKIFPLE